MRFDDRVLYYLMVINSLCVIGPPVLAGLFVIVIVIPIYVVITNTQRKMQTRQMIIKDERIKNMNEILNGMKVREFVIIDNIKSINAL